MFSYPDAAESLRARLQNPISGQLEGAAIDTRKIQPGNIFIAIHGEKQDGHDYLEQAFTQGASGALVSESWLKLHLSILENPKIKNILAVPDTPQGLVDLAKSYRRTFQIQAYGITGSIGKTSTKEFSAYLLAQKFPVLSTVGNFNNHLGLPLTLMRLKPEHRICVAELGANHVGEISFLADILKPDAAILTRVAAVHLEGFGSLENIYKAKGEIFEALKPGSFAVVPDEDPLISFHAERLKLKPIPVGESFRAHYRLTEVSVREGRVHFCINKKYHFSFPGAAAFLAQNAAMAIALAESAAGFKITDMPEDWEIQMPAGRFEESKVGPFTFIFDGYNASPAAFDAALKCFASMESLGETPGRAGGRKFVAFSDMLELGAEEKTYHQKLGEKIAAYDLHSVCYGKRSQWAHAAIRESGKPLISGHFEGSQAAAEFLDANVQPGDAVLLKASRGMKVEEVLNYFQKKYQTDQIVKN